ncbi:MAG: hypothetical protein WCR29_04535 [Bacteroidales bacterium]|nr:hypothetical protein [Bacteroidales bacterium]
MIDKLRKDNYAFGAIVGLMSIILTALVLLLGLSLFSKGYSDDPKLFLFSFIPSLLLMRWYFKIEHIKTAKSIIIIIIITFIPYFIFLYTIGVFNTISK